MPRPARIGVTMRVAPATRPGESARDLFPDDWQAALAAALPEAAWWPLANRGATILRDVAALRLDALVLAGGSDLGTCPRRDETEQSLLLHCAGRGIPVLGVCRGLQLIQSCFGGDVARAPDTHDAGRLHAIDVPDPRARRLLGTDRFAAPSYHRFGVVPDRLAGPLEAWACSPDGWVEMLAHRSAPIVAVQWHPERPLPEPEVAQRLLRGFADVL